MTDDERLPGALEKLRLIVGFGNVSTERADCDLATADIFEWPDRKRAAAVVLPKDTSEVSGVLKVLHAANIATVPRGAGLSYTGGLAVERTAVVVDVCRLTDMTIHQDDCYATVGAGASWQSVAERARSHNLRSLQASPISGAFSTVGGLASQGLPAGTGGILGLTVVLHDGTIVRTGADVRSSGSGPDLTGIFLGDCGAFGIKTEVVIRLGRLPSAAFATFDFEDANSLIASLNACMREGVASRAFALDRLKSQQAKRADWSDAISAGVAVLRLSRSPTAAVKSGFNLLKFASSRGRERPWSLHLTIEAPTPNGAAASLQRVREICRNSGIESPDVFPRALHAKPYSVRGMVGPDGERWVPVHGIFRPSAAQAAMQALQHHLQTAATTMERLGANVSWLVSSSGAYVLIEPMIYWRDSLDPLHMKYLSPKNRERFGAFAAHTEAREFVRALRLQLRDIMDAHGASHSQIGRFYDLGSTLDENAIRVIEKIKSMLDPADLMNPGVLGLGARSRGGAAQ